MLYFENRQLKREIERLEKEIESQNDHLGQKIKITKDQDKIIQSKEDKLIDLGRKLDKSNRQLKKVSKIVRQQTGADLLVNALKELGVVPLSDMEPDHFHEAKKLQSQMASMQNNIDSGRIKTHNPQAGDFGGYQNQLGGLGVAASGQDSAFNQLFR